MLYQRHVPVQIPAALILVLLWPLGCRVGGEPAQGGKVATTYRPTHSVLEKQDFKKASLFVVSGEYLFAYWGPRGSRGWRTFYLGAGLDSLAERLSQTTRSELQLGPHDTIRQASYWDKNLGYSGGTRVKTDISTPGISVVMQDGSTEQEFCIYDGVDWSVSKQLNGPNPNFLYLSLKDRKIALKNGFVGTIRLTTPDARHPEGMIKFPLVGGIPVTIVQRTFVTEFGESKWKDTGTFEKLLPPTTLKSLDYLCVSIEGVEALLASLHSEPVETEYPFMLKLKTLGAKE